MSPIYSLKLGFQMQKTDIKASNIDDSAFKIFKIVIIGF